MNVVMFLSCSDIIVLYSCQCSSFTQSKHQWFGGLIARWGSELVGRSVKMVFGEERIDMTNKIINLFKTIDMTEFSRVNMIE